jgi:hypothetical protein
MPTDTIKWIEINLKVLDTVNDNRSIIGSTEVGYIISIDKNTKTAIVKWEETQKKDTVHLVIAKSITNWTSFQGNGNQQISFVRYHRQRGGSHLLAT